jgi:hypothetical protein
MMGLYEDCIASGESPALCAATFGGPSGGDTKATLIGAELFSPDRQFAGVLVKDPLAPVQAKPGETIDRLLARRRANPGGIVQKGLFLQTDKGLIPFTGGSFLTSFNEGVTLSATGSITTSRDLPLTSATGAAPSFTSTQAGLQQQFQNDQALLTQRHENDLAQLNAQLASAQGINRANIQANIDLENLRHENDLAEMALQFENQLKQTTLGEIGATTRTLIQERGQERARQTELAGRDIFKFTANLRGRSAGTAPTPVDVFKQQGAEFVNRPLPQVDPNAPLSELQAGLSALQKLEAPQGQGIFGLAHGGTVTAPGQIAPLEMQRGSDGAFSLTPAIVGDDGPELALLPPGAKIIPLSKLQGMDLSSIPRAQGGLDIPNLNLGGFPDLLDFLRRSTGLTAPSFFDTPGNTRIDVRAPLLRQDAARLGAFQRAPGSLLVGAENFGQPRSGPVFVVDESGRIRPFTNNPIFQRSGFRGEDVQTIPFHQLSRFQRGPAISNQPFSLPEPGPGPLPEFQTFGEPLNTLPGLLDLARFNPDFSEADASSMANRIGFLPAPAKIARQIGIGGANLDDQEIQGLLSLYGLANIDLNTFFRQIEAATPTGRLGRPQRIGFTGARL